MCWALSMRQTARGLDLRRVVTRFAATKLDGLQVEYRVEKYSDEVVVRLIVLNREEWYRQQPGWSRGLPSDMRKPDYADGELVLKQISTSKIRDQCMSNVQDLWDREGQLDVWVVRSVLLGSTKLWSRGLGKEMYLKGFKAISPAIVTSDHCGGGQTSPSAKRVWESLKSAYPHSGTGDDVAVKV